MADTTGKSLGSNTVQNLASQNLLGEVGQGLGLPGIAKSGLLGRVAGVADKTYSLFGIPDQLKQKLANVMLNPNSPESQAIISRLTQRERSQLAQAVASAGGLVGQSTGIGVSQ